MKLRFETVLRASIFVLLTVWLWAGWSRAQEISQPGGIATVNTNGVIGVSTNSDESHENWTQECGLRFPLVADPAAELTTSLGLMKQYGDYGEFADRVTFLLDRDGTVKRVWTVEDIDAHAAEALEAARELVA